MSQQTRIALVRPIIYLVAAACVAVVSMGAIWWEPYTPIQYSYVPNTCKTPYSDAWGEPANGAQPVYWVMRGQVVSVWVNNVEDLDYWYDNTNPLSYGYELDVVPEQNVVWDQGNGWWWVDENENNNNNNENGPGPGSGYTVRWVMNNDATEGWVRLLSLDDLADMGNEHGEECYGDRKDGPQAENVTVVNFRVFEISGPSELWYWGERFAVAPQYEIAGIYSVPLVNSNGLYQWQAAGSLKIRQNYSAPYCSAISGLGIASVEGRFFGKSDGAVAVTYVPGMLHGSMSVKAWYPNRSIGINWAEYPNAINAMGRGPFDANRAVGKHYDFAATGGYETWIGYHLQDQNNQNVPYWYWFQEYFTSTNGGNGWRVWSDPGENWPCPPYVRDGQFGGGSYSGIPSPGTNDVWHDMVGRYDADWFIPHVQTPGMPSRDGRVVDYVTGLWTFGTDAGTISEVYTMNCNWNHCLDCGRHN